MLLQLQLLRRVSIHYKDTEHVRNLTKAGAQMIKPKVFLFFRITVIKLRNGDCGSFYIEANEGNAHRTYYP